MVEFVGWLRPAILPTVKAMDRFPEVFNAGPERYREIAEPLAEALQTHTEERKAKRMTRAERRQAAAERANLQEGSADSAPPTSQSA